MPGLFGPAFPLGSNPSFADLLRAASSGREPWPSSAGQKDPAVQPHQIAHGTTILALKFADGVVMAGDRRGAAGGPTRAGTRGKRVPRARACAGCSLLGAAGA